MITSKILCKLTSVDTYYQSNQNPFDIMKIQNGPLMINLDDMRKVLRIFCKPIDSMLCQSIESMGLQKIPIKEDIVW